MYLGAGDGDDGLAAFARAAGPRTERLRQRYGQESQPASSDDEHDDYGNKDGHQTTYTNQRPYCLTV